MDLQPDIGITTDHFNLLPIEMAGQRDFVEEIPIQVEQRPNMLIMRTIICSQCGRSVKRSLDIDKVNSSSGIGHFCRQECAEAFRKTELNMLTPELASIVETRLRSGIRVEAIALGLRVSVQAVAKMKLDLSIEETAAPKVKNWLL